MVRQIVKYLVAALGVGLAANNVALASGSEVALVLPVKTVLDSSLSTDQIRSQSLAARRYYTFWHTGDPRFAQAALADNFKDLNLPTGRPQGLAGPLQASKNFRAAVPDLRVEVTEMMIVGDRVIGRLHFTGHFTGVFMGERGTGQSIDFSAVDIYRIEQGKIVENWHLEDNLTLLQQLGVVAMKK